MSNSVLTISHDHSVNELNTLLRDDKSPVRFIHVDHGVANQKVDTNLVKIARKNNQAHEILTVLANNGFYSYMSRENATRFVHERSLQTLWVGLKSGEYTISAEGIVYSYTKSADFENPKRLLVIFSSIHNDMNTPSLMRYFAQNFATVQKYIPGDTAILRIADLGGIAGAFYVNTMHLPNNLENVQKLIETIRAKLRIGRDAVVLYGASKGGTGALVHAIEGHYRCVSVDPIVADEYYEQRYNDLHFTGNGIFPETKEEIFHRMVEDLLKRPKSAHNHHARWSVICSDQSPQYKYISRTLINNLDTQMSFYNSRNILINDHPDVGPRTINTATMLLNLHLYGLPIINGLYHID